MRPLLAVLAAAMLAAPAAAAPGDPRTILGVVEWPPALGTQPFLVVRGDDGRSYAVDIQNAQRRGSGPIGAGNRISVVGVEAARPYEVSALAIGVGEAATTAPSPSPMPPPAPGAVTAPAMTSPPGPAPQPLWRLQGRIEALVGASAVIRAPDGASHTVELSLLSDLTRRSLRVGDEVTLFGVPRDDRRLVANGYIQMEEGPPSASPRGTN
jgi:hypothetical protein